MCFVCSYAMLKDVGGHVGRHTSTWIGGSQGIGDGRSTLELAGGEFGTHQVHVGGDDLVTGLCPFGRA